MINKMSATPMPLVSKMLDYKKTDDYSHPKYKLFRRTQQSGGDVVVITPAGGQESVFEIPINVYNLSKSYLRGSVFIPPPAVVSRTNHLYNSQLCLIAEMQLYNQSGVNICDAKYVNVLTDIVSKPETSIEDFLTQPDAKYVTAFLNRNNSASTSINSLRYNNSPPSSAYTENQYFILGGATIANPPIGAPLEIPFQFPLAKFYNTMCEIDKDVYFGETVYLRIRWAPSTRIGWTSEVTFVPGEQKFVLDADGDIILVDGQPQVIVDRPPGIVYNPDLNPAALNVNVIITQLELYLAQEEDVAIQNALKSLVSGGMTYRIPYIIANKASYTGTTQNVTIRLGPGQGRRLKRIYHAFYNPVEEANTAYDHNNRNNMKCLQYYSTLNNAKRQDFNIIPNQLTDYMINSDRLKGSVLQNSDQFLYNYFVLDDFTEDEQLFKKKSKIGIDEGVLINSNLQWDIYCIMPNAVPNNQLTNHYTFAIVSRDLYVGPGGMRLD